MACNLLKIFLYTLIGGGDWFNTVTPPIAGIKRYLHRGTDTNKSVLMKGGHHGK